MIINVSNYLRVPASTCRYLEWPVSNGWPADVQVPDLWARITRGNLSARIQVAILKLKIPAGQVQVDPQVNSWSALLEPLSLLLPFLGVIVVVAMWRRGWYVGCVLSVVRRVVVSSLIPKKLNKKKTYLWPKRCRHVSWALFLLLLVVEPLSVVW